MLLRIEAPAQPLKAITNVVAEAGGDEMAPGQTVKAVRQRPVNITCAGHE